MVVCFSFDSVVFGVRWLRCRAVALLVVHRHDQAPFDFVKLSAKSSDRCSVNELTHQMLQNGDCGLGLAKPFIQNDLKDIGLLGLPSDDLRIVLDIDEDEPKGTGKPVGKVALVAYENDDGQGQPADPFDESTFPAGGGPPICNSSDDHARMTDTYYQCRPVLDEHMKEYNTCC